MTYVKRKATSKRAQRTANDEEYKNYSPTRLITGSTIPAADSHAKCGKVAPRGARPGTGDAIVRRGGCRHLYMQKKDILLRCPSYKSGYNILTRTFAVPSARC